MVNALVVYVHPRSDSFAAAVRDRVLDVLETEGHRTAVLDLYSEGFDPRLTAEEHRLHRAPPESKPQIATHVALVRSCDTLVLVYPTWWSTLPAMLKGWFERVWVNGVAAEVHDDGRPPSPLLTNIRRIVVVTTHGSPKWLNAVQGESGKRFAKRSLRASVNRRCRVHWIALYGIDRSSAQQRSQFLERVSRRLARIV